MYDLVLVLARAVDYAIVVIPPAEVDARGVHVANIEGMHRAIARLTATSTTCPRNAASTHA
jgi:ribonuclease HII